jgi:hypothetical protein
MKSGNDSESFCYLVIYLGPGVLHSNYVNPSNAVTVPSSTYFTLGD